MGRHNNATDYQRNVVSKWTVAEGFYEAAPWGPITQIARKLQARRQATPREVTERSEQRWGLAMTWDLFQAPGWSAVRLCVAVLEGFQLLQPCCGGSCAPSLVHLHLNLRFHVDL